MEYFNQLNSNTKKLMRDCSMLAVIGFFTIWWFPINLLFIHLVTKAYTKNRENLFSTFLMEFWDLVNYGIAKGKELAKYASPQEPLNRSINSTKNNETKDEDESNDPTEDNDDGEGVAEDDGDSSDEKSDSLECLQNSDFCGVGE